uniref:Uncharacterized protein n=1 Tax=Oryza brachyantha TaxID=4533 RepID=J3LRU0_ORYBR
MQDVGHPFLEKNASIAIPKANNCGIGSATRRFRCKTMQYLHRSKDSITKAINNKGFIGAHLDRDSEEKQANVALDLSDGVEGYGSPREVLEKVDRVLHDAYAVEAEVGVDVRDGARADAAAAGGWTIS